MRDARKVLVVDDEDVVCRSYERVLTEAGYSVRTTTSGLSALEAVQEEPFDVLIADLRLPDINGLSVTRVAKRVSPNLQVIIITGYPTRESSDEATRIGVARFVEKPVAPDTLTAATAEAIAGISVRPAEPARQAEPAPLREEPPVVLPNPPRVEAPASRGWIRDAALLVAAPFLGLAYVIFLPFIGFAMVAALAFRSTKQWVGRWART